MKPYFRLEHLEIQHKDTVVVNWCLSNVCNYKCTYCPEILHDHSRPFPELQTVMGFCDKVLAHNPGKRVYFEFTGGEVTLWKELTQLFDYLKGKKAEVGFISNGSRSLDWWSKHKSKFDHVCLSFHPESANKEHFIEVVREIHMQVRVHVNVMMWADQFAYCEETARAVAALGNVSLACQPLIVDFKDQLYAYSEGQKDFMERKHKEITNSIRFTQGYKSYRGSMVKVTETGDRFELPAHEFIAKGENSWEGWKCNIGLEQIVVDFHGNISRGWCGVGGVIGHISDASLSLPNQSITCNKASCHCNFDIMSTKYVEL